MADFMTLSNDGNLAVPSGFINQEGMGFSAFLANRQNITAGKNSFTKVALDTTDFNIDTVFDTINSEFVVAVSGTYLFTASASFFGLTSLDTVALGIYKNGSQVFQGGQIPQNGGRTLGFSTSVILQLDAGSSPDKVDFRVFHDSSQAQIDVVEKSSGVVFTMLQGWLLG